MLTGSHLDIPLLRGPVPIARVMIRQFVREGDQAVDATCGNGNDTLLLAELVGDSGRVWAFDIQQLAICQTNHKLTHAALANRVELVQAGHETMAEHVPDGLAAVVFNLGYLPGGDQGIITRPETTMPALEQSLSLLRPGGILAVTIYPGHDGGASERRTVDAWATGLSQKEFHPWRMGQLNVPYDAPYFILIQKAF